MCGKIWTLDYNVKRRGNLKQNQDTRSNLDKMVYLWVPFRIYHMEDQRAVQVRNDTRKKGPADERHGHEVISRQICEDSLQAIEVEIVSGYHCAISISTSVRLLSSLKVRSWYSIKRADGTHSKFLRMRCLHAAKR